MNHFFRKPYFYLALLLSNGIFLEVIFGVPGLACLVFFVGIITLFNRCRLMVFLALVSVFFISIFVKFSIYHWEDLMMLLVLPLLASIVGSCERRKNFVEIYILFVAFWSIILQILDYYSISSIVNDARLLLIFISSAIVSFVLIVNNFRKRHKRSLFFLISLIVIFRSILSSGEVFSIFLVFLGICVSIILVFLFKDNKVLFKLDIAIGLLMSLVCGFYFGVEIGWGVGSFFVILLSVLIGDNIRLVSINYKFLNIFYKLFSCFLVIVGVLWLGMGDKFHYKGRIFVAREACLEAFYGNDLEGFDEAFEVLGGDANSRDHFLAGRAALKFRNDLEKARAHFACVDRSFNNLFLEGIVWSNFGYYEMAQGCLEPHIDELQNYWSLIILNAIKCEKGRKMLDVLSRNSPDFKTEYWLALEERDFLKRLKDELWVNRDLVGFSEYKKTILLHRWASGWYAQDFINYWADSEDKDLLRSLGFGRVGKIREALALSKKFSKGMPVYNISGRDEKLLWRDLKIHGDLDAGLALYELALERNNHKQAMNILEDVVSSDPSHEGFSWALANLKEEEKDIEGAWGIVNQLLLGEIFKVENQTKTY